MVSPIANAIAIPAVTFAVVPLALCAIVVPLDLPWQAAHAVFSALMVPLEALAAAPSAAWQQHAAPGWAVASALSGVALLVAPRGVPGVGFRHAIEQILPRELLNMKFDLAGEIVFGAGTAEQGAQSEEEDSGRSHCLDYRQL